MRGAYEGPLARMAISAEKVAGVIEKAISAKRPRARYPVGVPARMGIMLKRVSPDRVFDAVMRTQFRSPDAPS